MKWTWRVAGLGALGLFLVSIAAACGPINRIRQGANDASTAAAGLSTAAAQLQTVTSGDLATSIPAVLGTAAGQIQTATSGLGTAVANPTTQSALGDLGTMVVIFDQGSKTTFVPDSVTIRVGATVRWTNTTTRTQSVVAEDGSWTTGDILTFGTGQFKFEKAGTFSYFSRTQPDSKAKVIVQ